MSAAHAPRPNNPSIPNFEVDDCLKSWNLPAKEWLIKHEKNWDGLATGSIVFNSRGRVLLVQRASHDSMPNKWEIPGGAVDDEDNSLLTGAAREIWEEAGLVATRFTNIVSEGPAQEPGQVYTNSKGTKVWCRFCFVAEVEDCDHVRLDPNEHQNFVWATVDEVRLQRIGDREIPITTDSMLRVILEAFRLRIQEAEGS